jgi:hypothetical protein
VQFGLERSQQMQGQQLAKPAPYPRGLTLRHQSVARMNLQMLD